MLFCVEQQGFCLSADVVYVGVTNYSYIAFYYYKLYMVKQNDQKNSKKKEASNLLSQFIWYYD